jgi:hypothetical protein
MKLKKVKSKCILWPYGKNKAGYGILRVKNKFYLAHRWAWEQENEKIPNNLCVLHKCDVRACINIKHLFLGTRADNNQDKENKGRSVVLRGISHGISKLTEKDVRNIRKLYKSEEKISQKKIGEMYGVTDVTISYILSRKLWKHLED